MRYALTACMLALYSAVASGIPIVNGDGATVDDLIREGAYITLLIGNAPIKNLKIKSINESTITVTDSVGVSQPYPVSLVRQIRVQDGRLEAREMVDRRLTPDEQAIVRSALDRAFQLFDRSGDQQMRMLAALVNAAAGNSSALDYLRNLANGNDPAVALNAAGFLHLAGGTVSDEIIAKGFSSGNRAARAEAARLAGLLGRTVFQENVRGLLKDPTAEVYIQAAVAAGRLGDRAALPDLYGGLTKLSREEGLAAAYGISLIGGEDVNQFLWSRVRSEGAQRSETWYRSLLALFWMGDEAAKNELRDEAMKQPAFDVSVALELADDGDWAATEFLRAYMNRRQDPSAENLINRAFAAGQLFKGGMLEAKVILRDLARISPSQIYAKDYQSGQAFGDEYKQATLIGIQAVVARIIGNLGSPDLLSLLPPLIASENPAIAIIACLGAVQIQNPAFLERIVEYDIS
jgi:HEAT repeat protein